MKPVLFQLSDESYDNELRNEWQQVAMVIDRLMFFVFFIGTLAVVVHFYNLIPKYLDNERKWEWAENVAINATHWQ